MLVLLHGFPNSMRQWDNLKGGLEADNLVLNVSYPNFSKEVTLKWGLELGDVVVLLKKTIELVETNNSKEYKKTFIIHDWGSAIGFLFDLTYPGVIHDMVTLDIGIPLDQSIYAQLVTVTYQSYLASAFLIGGPIGDFMVRNFVKYLVPAIWGPNTEKLDDEFLTASIAYYYFHFIKKFVSLLKMFIPYVPSCPVAFIYGKSKNFMFHDKLWLDKIKDKKHTEIHEIADEGHWVNTKSKNNQFLTDLIKRRLNTIK